MSAKATNITPHHGTVSRGDRERQLGQRGAVVWFTGLSGSGKSTVARAVEQQLYALGHAVYVLDGDNIRTGLNADLGFGDDDRTENIRRLGHVASLFADSGLITLTAFISPFRADRSLAQKCVGEASFVEVFIDTPLDVCEQRDPKGLYKKARAGDIPSFTGISSPYEAPENPSLRVATADQTPEQSAAQVVEHLRAQGVLSGPA